jgi:hypothetical protein
VARHNDLASKPGSIFMSPQNNERKDKTQKLQDYKEVQDDIMNKIIENRRKKEKERLENL